MVGCMCNVISECASAGQCKTKPNLGAHGPPSDARHFTGRFIRKTWRLHICTVWPKSQVPPRSFLIKRTRGPGRPAAPHRRRCSYVGMYSVLKGYSDLNGGCASATEPRPTSDVRPTRRPRFTDATTTVNREHDDSFDSPGAPRPLATFKSDGGPVVASARSPRTRNIVSRPTKPPTIAEPRNGPHSRPITTGTTP